MYSTPESLILNTKITLTFNPSANIGINVVLLEIICCLICTKSR
jgi:hypothetical protein